MSFPPAMNALLAAWPRRLLRLTPLHFIFFSIHAVLHFFLHLYRHAICINYPLPYAASYPYPYPYLHFYISTFLTYNTNAVENFFDAKFTPISTIDPLDFEKVDKGTEKNAPCSKKIMLPSRKDLPGCPLLWLHISHFGCRKIVAANFATNFCDFLCFRNIF